MRYYLNYAGEIATLLVSYLLFYFNIFHRSEQTIYKEIYTPLAQKLNLFRYSITDQVMDSYPMWGYPITLSVFQNNQDGIIYLQFLLLLISSVIYFYCSRTFNNSGLNRILISILFMFYSLCISVKWPDAILIFLLFIFCFSHIKGKYTIAAISLAFAYNFRSEAIIFLIIYSIYLLTQRKKLHLLSLIFLLPWNILQYYSNDRMVLTSSNSGSVLYITLGQLEENVWNIEHSDSFAKEKVIEFSNGEVANPWGLKANDIMKKKFINNISEYPYEFLRKLLTNFKSSLLGGFYSGELHHHQSVGNEIFDYKENKFLIIKNLMSFKKSAIFVSISSILRITSILALIYSLIIILNHYRIKIIRNIFFWIILSQFAMTWFIHYQPRHVSHIIPILIFLVIQIQTKSYPNHKVSKIE